MIITTLLLRHFVHHGCRMRAARAVCICLTVFLSALIWNNIFVFAKLRRGCHDCARKGQMRMMERTKEIKEYASNTPSGRE